MGKGSKRLFLIGQMILGISILCCSIGYAALEEQVTISGNMVYRKDTNIRVTNVTVDTASTGTISYTPEYQVATVQLGTKLDTLVSTVTYHVEIENKSDAYEQIESIVPTSNTNEDMQYEIGGYTIGSSIDPDETITLDITISYNTTTLPTNTTGDLILVMTFKEAALEADEIYYDSSSSGLEADTLQEAIDKLAEMI